MMHFQCIRMCSFAGFLALEEQPRLTFEKKKKTTPPPFIYMNSLLYSIRGLFNNSCVAETSCALPIGAVILHLRSFSRVC